MPRIELDLSLDQIREGTDRVPEGRYLLDCLGCEHPLENPTSHVVSVVFSYRIVQGPDAYPQAGIGGRLIDFVTLWTPNKPDMKPWALTSELEALGRTDVIEAFAKMQASQRSFEIPSPQADAVFDRISQAVRGKQAVGHVADQPGSNPPRSRIEKLQSVNPGPFSPGWEVLRKSAEYRPEAGPGFAAPTTRANGPAAAGAPDLFSDLDRAI